ncbi:macrolide 2'-phosphotransferase [Sorangium sp. So ce131]|uniref:macrolide 2'-phosphotransferase n=1 Tax=Sorangium sp. So ce131 TaxID=3133282 RepID=UPI003F5D5EC0
MSMDTERSGLSHPVLAETRADGAVADLLEAARREGLRLTTDHADFDRSGLDFLVVHARDDEGVPWIVRTPRRPDVVESARVEARVLELIRPRLPVAVPHWRVYAPDVIAYPRLDGTPAVTLGGSGAPSWNIVDPSAPSEVFLDSFARALAALQAISPEAAGRAGVPVKTIAEERDAVRRSVQETRGVLAPSDAVWARWQRWLDDDALWPRHVALAHADLHPGHMLLAPDGQLVGILDWTTAMVTDPSMDLAMFCGCFGKGALESFLPRFERAGGRSWPRLADHAAERWAVFPALAAEWALRTGNEAVLEHARGLLAQVTA